MLDPNTVNIFTDVILVTSRLSFTAAHGLFSPLQKYNLPDAHSPNLRWLLQYAFIALYSNWQVIINANMLITIVTAYILIFLQ